VSTFVVLSLSIFASAQTQTSRYIYDDDGRLRAVIAPSGEAAVYDYDAAGNFTAIRRLAADALELLTFAPRSGVPGIQVVFQGVGFGAGVSAVTFTGGVAGTIVEFTNNTITAIVPEGTVTGPITITTIRGTVMTAVPFVLEGVIVNPIEVSVIDGESVQFNANVIVPGDDHGVIWTVNGVEGGSDILGRIDETGLYTGPLDVPATFNVTVRATSTAFPTLEGTATVHVRSLSDFRYTITPGVSIAKGGAFATPFVFGPGVSVGKGPAFTVASVFTPGVSIGKGASFINQSVLSRGIAIGKNANFANGGAFSAGVMLTKGPIISAISPPGITQGSTVTITLNGLNFSGANDVRLLNLDGSDPFGVTASNIIVNGNGTSLTVTLSTQTFTSVGRKIVVVTTPTAHSLRTDVNVNTIQITPP
jgi:YD repeat-containing protein